MGTTLGRRYNLYYAKRGFESTKVGTYGRYTLSVFTGRENGCHFWTPVNTARELTPATHWWLFDTRVHGPWTRIVCTELYAAFSAFSSQESPCQQCDTGSYSLMTSGVRAPDLQIWGPVRYTRVRGHDPYFVFHHVLLFNDTLPCVCSDGQWLSDAGRVSRRITTRAQQLLRWVTVWAQQTWAQKWGGAAGVRLSVAGAGSSSNTMPPGPRPTSVPRYLDPSNR